MDTVHDSITFILVFTGRNVPGGVYLQGERAKGHHDVMELKENAAYGSPLQRQVMQTNESYRGYGEGEEDPYEEID